MKISFKGDYALKTIQELSNKYLEDPGQVEKTSDIAERLNIPLKFLGQILLTLKGAGYVHSRRGPDGGVSLAKAPREITVGEIVRLIDGTTSPITCVSCSNYTKCEDEANCIFRELWLQIRDSINAVVDKVTFDDICRRSKAKSGEKVLNFSI